MKQKIYELISRSMVPNITRGFANKSGNYIALFHGVHKKNYGLNTGAQNDLTVKQFSEVIEWLKPRFDFISPSQLFSKKKKGYY